MGQHSFELFGTVHTYILLVTILVATVWVLIYRVFKHPYIDQILSWTLASLLAFTKIAMVGLAWPLGELDVQKGLPMHLCDWTLFLMAFVLVCRVRWIYETVYFWGLTGTIQALLTPDLNFPLVDWRTVIFFVSHAGIVIGVVYLTLGIGMRPTLSSIWKAFVATQVYIFCAAVINILFNSNYGYICAKPYHPSLLDYLGPWPWYIFSVEALMVIFFMLCYAPFWILDHVKK